MVGSQAEEQSSHPPFPHRLLAAMVSVADWDTQSALAVEAGVRLGGAAAAILISASKSDRLDLVCCCPDSGSSLQLSRMTIDRPFGILIDKGATVEIAAESGWITGLQLQVHSWPDLVASVVVQIPDERVTVAESGIFASLAPVCRRLLSNVANRAVLIPDAGVLEAMAEFAAGAGHEINNPLASILGQTQLLLKNEQSAEKRQSLETIGAQAWRVRDMIGNSMLFARPPQPQRKRINLVEVIQRTLQPLTSVAADSDIELHLSSTSDQLALEADPTQISTLVAQLVRNGIEAIRSVDRPGRISLTLRGDQSGFVELSVSDDGPGIISEEVRRHLFNPFYSGRSAGRGLGFGLCLAWQIVRMHGGIILHDDADEGGAAFHVAFPATLP